MQAQIIQFPISSYVPLGLAFFGLGCGYLIYGPQELFGYPARSPSVDDAMGLWGIFMPGLCQLLNGTYILVGITWFHVFNGDALYAAGIITTLFGIHWLALGMIRMRRGDDRPRGYMCIAFVLLSLLGLIVFQRAGDWPVAVLFGGLIGVYVTEFFASFQLIMPWSLKGLGFFHTLTGVWLMYLTYAIVLNFASGMTLPL
jgi:hypothetical protein